jgi:hypothetical protein
MRSMSEMSSELSFISLNLSQVSKFSSVSSMSDRVGGSPWMFGL